MSKKFIPKRDYSEISIVSIDINLISDDSPTVKLREIKTETNETVIVEMLEE